MLILEQYRNTQMAELYKNCMTEGPLEYTEDLFKAMIEKGIIKHGNPKELALEFYGPFYLLIGLCDSGYDKKELLKLMDDHIETFLIKIGSDN